MKTIEAKDIKSNNVNVDMENVLLYTIVEDQIVLLVNDIEKLDKFKYSGKTTDAPILYVPYSEEMEYDLIKEMKQIKSYEKLTNYIRVNYKDGNKINFSLDNEDEIKKMLAAQNAIKRDVISSNWSKLPEEEKEKRKKNTKGTWKKALAAVLAALAIYGVAANKDKIAKAMQKNTDEDTNNEKKEQVLPTQAPTMNKETEYYLEVYNYDFSKMAKELHDETYSKNDFVIKYQQIVNIEWNEDLSKRVIELLNNKYSDDMMSLNDEDSYRKTTEALQAASLLVSGNLNPETKSDDMIDISRYFVRESDQKAVYNAMLLARNVMDESIGNPINGQIVEDVNELYHLSTEYISSVDTMLNYEYDVMNDKNFQKMSSGARWLVSNIFQQVNMSIPQESYIEKNINGEKTTIYYRCFVDSANGNVYYPMLGQNGNTDYRCDAIGKTYNMYEMFAMAGMSLVEEQRNVQIEKNPTIHQAGIQTLVEDELHESEEQIYDLREIAQNYVNQNTKGAK